MMGSWPRKGYEADRLSLSRFDCFEVQGKEQSKEDPTTSGGVQCGSVSLLLDQPSRCPVCEGHRSQSVLVTAVSLSSGSRTRRTKVVSLISCLPSFLRCLSLLSGISWVRSFLLTSPTQCHLSPLTPLPAHPLQLGGGEWTDTVARPQPAGLTGEPGPRAACRGGHQPAPGVLPLPLGQRL